MHKAPETPLNPPARRSFLKMLSAGLVTASSLQLVTAAKAGKPQTHILGAGDHRYKCIHNWGLLPEGHDYGNASHGTAFDEKGLLYITHQGGPGSVFVFDPNGEFVRSMFPEHCAKRGNAERASGHGIDIHKEADGQEYIYLSPADSNMAFTKATLKGEIVWTKGKADLEKDAGMKLGRYRPTNTSFGPDGSVFLGDGYGSQYIFHYTSSGDFVGVFGGPGSDNGKFKTPHGQWLDQRDGVPKTVICDRANMRLQWFDLHDNHLKTLDGFLFPADIDIQGDVMLVPDLHARVTLLDKDNKVIAQLGDDEAWRERVLDKSEQMRAHPEKWQAGKFVHPHDAAFDKKGNIFVAEWVVGGRVTKLEKVS